MMSKKVRDLARRLRASGVAFDGDGHIFVFDSADDYEHAQKWFAHLMTFPKASRPRGWSRGRNADGVLFVRLRMH